VRAAEDLPALRQGQRRQDLRRRSACVLRVHGRRHAAVGRRRQLRAGLHRVCGAHGELGRLGGGPAPGVQGVQRRRVRRQDHGQGPAEGACPAWRPAVRRRLRANDTGIRRRWRWRPRLPRVQEDDELVEAGCSEVFSFSLSGPLRMQGLCTNLHPDETMQFLLA
jgi:hypothetical protein